MHKLLLILRTLRHVKPIQIWNRIWRKRLSLFTRNRKPETRNYKLETINSSPLPEFTFLNTTARPEGWNDKRMEKLWLYNLHYFDWLQDNSHGEQREHVELLERWIQENPVGWGNGWEPYPISLRVVNWIKFLVSSLKFKVSSLELKEDSREKIEASLREQVAYLMPRLEYHLLANHLLANAKALVFAGAYLKEDRWLKKGLAIYRKELPEQTCADGVNFERSPMYHCIILEDVLDCYAILKEVSSGKEVSSLEFLVSSLKMFEEYAGRMLMGLKMLVGPDGRIAKFNDSTEGIAKTPAYLFDYAKRLGINPDPATINCKLETINSSGFVRKEAGSYTMLAKCGAIGPSYQPGHAHADTFSFELWRGTEKIVGDTGCSTYVPGPIRSYERSTAAHNTVVIDGRNSSEVWAAHRVGRRVQLFDLRLFDCLIEGAYRDQFGNVIKRKLQLTEHGLEGVDEVVLKSNNQATKQSNNSSVSILFHLPPDVDASSVAITSTGERHEESCEFAAGWNRREAGTCVIYHQECVQSKIVTFTWSIR